jgi:hypothetical protein
MDIVHRVKVFSQTQFYPTNGKHVSALSLPGMISHLFLAADYNHYVEMWEEIAQPTHLLGLVETGPCVTHIWFI